LVFHGFGQDLGVFDFFTRSLSRQYTFYVFDLYFHGKSTWGNGERPLEKEAWKKTIDLFLAENNIGHFHLAAFSLGGKFALATLEAFPDKIETMHLIAPDGIKTSFWYSLATYPVIFRKLFRSMILHPDRFMRMAAFLNKTGLVDKGLIRFAEYQMNTAEKRSRVYHSWVVFRHLKFNVPALADLINSKNIGIVLIVGKYDKVITPANMKGLVKRLKHCRFEILESGHTGLINQSIPFFTELNK
jgi:pimeloyl-ACP methyl ester carboxylesterase